MPDNLDERGPTDRTRINVNELWELRWWTKKWNVSEEQLRATVKDVGVMAHDVARRLGKST
jgi:hypothetical protein